MHTSFICCARAGISASAETAGTCQARKGTSVDYVRLGSAGLKVSRICLGMMSYGSQAERAWTLDEAAAEPIVKAAVDGGITFFDTADMYSGGTSEEITGRLLGRLFARRDDYVLATKVYFPMGAAINDGGLSRKHVLSAIDASLRRLGVDYVDLYQIHRWDDQTPIEETMEALHEVVKAIANKIGLTYDLKQVFYYEPVAFDKGCVDAVRRAAQRFGYSHRDIVSGAGHDACYLAGVCPTSMIFTPCVDGVSHNESEDIKMEWSTAGANVLMHAVLEKAEIVG